MKIQYASDLHLEFSANTMWLKQNPLIATGDVLVLAGDISLFKHSSSRGHVFWDVLSEQFKQVFVVPGNHELYQNFDINELYDGWNLEIRKNIHYIYNSVMRIDDDTDLIATTLWSKIPCNKTFQMSKHVADFWRIQNSGQSLSIDRFNEEHMKCIKFIEKALSETIAKHVVVATHHVPSSVLSTKEHRESSINEAFVVELYDFIASSNIDYWIYGHSHRNIDEVIGDTKCVSNQLGYVKYNEHMTFDRQKIISFEV